MAAAFFSFAPSLIVSSSVKFLPCDRGHSFALAKTRAPVPLNTQRSVGAYLEDVVLGWLLSLFGLSPTSAGAFVTGTQMADVTALAAARHFAMGKAGAEDCHLTSEFAFGQIVLRMNGRSPFLSISVWITPGSGMISEN